MSDPTIQSPTAFAMKLLESGDSIKAIAVMRQLIEREPASALHHYHLSLIFIRIGQGDDALLRLRDAIAIAPNFAAAYLNQGVLQFGRGDVPAAEQSFRAAIANGQDDEGAWRNLGKSLRAQDRFDEAEQAFRNALARNPKSPEAWMMLGSVLRESGQITESIAATRRAIALKPDYREAHSNLCYAMYFDPHTSPADLLAMHLDWAAKFTPPPVAAAPANPEVAPLYSLPRYSGGGLGRGPSAIAEQSSQQAEDAPSLALPRRTGGGNNTIPPVGERLRIGYVSPYFRNHVVGAFMEPILKHHDRKQFAITCYSDTNPEDALTERLRDTDTTWRQTAGFRDAMLAMLIAQDEIDILVDLTLHMRGCRLGAFAAKPAPIQVTHLAYCGTSGLSQMDYCITDAHMISPGVEAFFSEKLLPLPTSYWCYQPPVVAPEVGPLPMLTNGYVTFGSLNSAAKINDEVVRVWSQLLHSVPNSKLTIHVPHGSQSLPARFARHGIASNRLNLVPRQSLSEYFYTWNQIDIGLDPFPYNGGTTTLDALWMGVPVITLTGALPVGRAGVSILHNLKLTQLITESEINYLDAARQLTTDPANLSSLRKNARRYILESPLLNAPGYVSELEAAYRLAAMRRTV